jgi:UDP-N-acetyl-D-mannosaminuronic acid dehydrogenase
MMEYDICVIGGCGHVGLPLSIAFALRGKRVAIFDSDTECAEQVRSGVMPFLEEGGPAMLRQALDSGRLVVAREPVVVAGSAAVVLVVGTPVDGHLAPSFQGIDVVLQSYRPYLRDDQLLILRSTLYPGTSARVQRWLAESGLKIDVAVCPERVAQGFGLKEIFSLPQIVAAFSQRGLIRAKELFGTLHPDLIVMEPLEAELSKLFANAWRYIKFAAANQFFIIAQDLGADFDRIYEGLTHEYPRAADLPPPGFTAGPCLFKDTMQLSSFTSNNFLLGHAAMLVNEGLPHYVVAALKKRLDLASLTVGILGMAFKANVDDGRDSLSFKLQQLLEIEAKDVVCSDPYLKQKGFVSETALIDASDLIIIATPHSCYRSLDFRGKPVVDIWNITGKGRKL